MAIVFKNGTATCRSGTQNADFTWDVSQAQRSGAREPTVAGYKFIRLWFRHDDQRDKYAMLSDAFKQVVNLRRRVAVNANAEWILANLA
jgi:hypothetical protein